MKNPNALYFLILILMASFIPRPMAGIDHNSESGTPVTVTHADYWQSHGFHPAECNFAVPA